MTIPIGYGRLWVELEERLPELRQLVLAHRYAAGGEELGPHVVFGDVLVPWIESQLVINARSPELLRAFELLEEMSKDPDPRVQEVVQMTVCEGLLDAPELLRSAWELMGPATRELASQIESFWERLRRERKA